jgi:hypothetical protein
MPGGEIIAVSLAQRSNKGITIFRPRLPVLIAVPIVQTWLSCHNSGSFHFIKILLRFFHPAQLRPFDSRTSIAFCVRALFAAIRGITVPRITSDSQRCHIRERILYGLPLLAFVLRTTGSLITTARKAATIDTANKNLRLYVDTHVNFSRRTWGP